MEKPDDSAKITDSAEIRNRWSLADRMLYNFLLCQTALTRARAIHLDMEECNNLQIHVKYQCKAVTREMLYVPKHHSY